MEHHHTDIFALADWIPLLLTLTVGIIYSFGHIRLLQKHIRWNAWRTLSFLAGILMLGMALYPDFMLWAHHDIRGHMMQHILVGMLGPTFLVLGAPLTLGFKTLPKATSRKITSVLKSNIFYVVSHPLTALMLNIGGMFVLYLTPLYVESLSSPYLHHLIHLHFLLAGYLFAWSIIGPDPAPRRPDFQYRMIIMFFAIAAHAFLSKYMYANLLPLNSPFSNEQIQEAAKLMYYWGDFSELILLFGLCYLWYKKRGSLPSGKMAVH
jgi:putative membrane protein